MDYVHSGVAIVEGGGAGDCETDGRAAFAAARVHHKARVVGCTYWSPLSVLMPCMLSCRCETPLGFAPISPLILLLCLLRASFVVVLLPLLISSILSRCPRPRLRLCRLHPRFRPQAAPSRSGVHTLTIRLLVEHLGRELSCAAEPDALRPLPERLAASGRGPREPQHIALYLPLLAHAASCARTALVLVLDLLQRCTSLPREALYACTAPERRGPAVPACKATPVRVHCATTEGTQRRSTTRVRAPRQCVRGRSAAMSLPW